MSEQKEENRNIQSNTTKQAPLKRRWRNYLLNPQFQLKFSIYFILSIIASVGLMIALIFTRLQGVKGLILQNYGEDLLLQSHLNQAIFEITLISFSILIGFSCISFIFSIIVTHRIAGPTLVICRFIEDLRKGNYESDRQLRQNDELKPIMDSLNGLATSLKNQSGS